MVEKGNKEVIELTPKEAKLIKEEILLLTEFLLLSDDRLESFRNETELQKNKKALRIMRTAIARAQDKGEINWN